MKLELFTTKNVWNNSKGITEINALNLYQINILNNTILMHQISTKTAKSLFLSKFKKPSHLYPTRFSNVNYIKPTHKLNKCKFGFLLEDLRSGMNF